MSKKFRRFGIITIVAVYFLILVGGIVRATGAGMGCPDWPKCFGMWIPPTDISQLPADYKEIFKVGDRVIADFNAFHTWTEYVNRLVGALIGVFIFLTTVFSFAYFKKDRVVSGLSIFAFFLVMFQGWLGAKVVSSFLAPYMITLHMLLALVIVGVLIYAVVRSHAEILGKGNYRGKASHNMWLIASIFLTLVQIGLGTQVREAVDHIAESLGGTNRGEWIDSLGIYFIVHRSFSILLLAVHLAFAFFILKFFPKGNKVRNWTYALLTLLGAETLTGIIIAYFGIPAPLQPVHLLLGSGIFGIQFVLLLLLNHHSFFKHSEGQKTSQSAEGQTVFQKVN